MGRSAGFLLVDGSESNPWYGAPSIELIRPLGAENDITAKAEPTTISLPTLVKATIMMNITRDGGRIGEDDENAYNLIVGDNVVFSG